MSIGLQFTGRIDHPEELLEAAAALAKTQGCRLTVGKGGLKIVLCPLGGELDLRWRPGEDQSSRFSLCSHSTESISAYPPGTGRRPKR